MNAYETASDRGFLLSGAEWKVVGGASLLMTLNVLVMYAFVVTPLAAVNNYVFAYPIVGVLVYGAAIMAGEVVAERGVDNGSLGVAVLGVAILQAAFGTFGAGILSFAPRSAQPTILGTTAIVVALMTAAIGIYVYARSKTSFDHYSSWANYAFLGGVVAVLVGTFVTPVLLVGFVLIFLGFIFRLGWEIWRIRDGRIASVPLQAIGLYIAVAGVFVHVLQLVMRIVARR